MWEQFNRKQWLLFGGIGASIVLLGIICLVLGIGQSHSEPLNDIAIISQSVAESSIVSEASLTESERSPAFLYVDVKGAVVQPNVYQLPVGARVVDAIQAAGGYTMQAATQQINQAQLLSDQMMLYVPTQEELQSESKVEVAQLTSPLLENNVSESEQGKVNINTATETELTQLSGIGAKKAQAIIEYRQTNGSFQSVEDLQQVKGIGVKLFEKIKDQVIVR